MCPGATTFAPGSWAIDPCFIQQDAIARASGACAGCACAVGSALENHKAEATISLPTPSIDIIACNESFVDLASLDSARLASRCQEALPQSQRAKCIVTRIVSRSCDVHAV